MASLTLLSVDKGRLSVAPGASVELAVTVQNLTNLLDQVAVRLEGIAPAWVEVIPPYLPVFAQGQASARVIIRPPRDPAQALAGRYPLRVRACSQENPGQEGETETELEIQRLGEYQFLLGPGEAHGAETNYSLAVQNEANAPLEVHFDASDPEGLLWYKFDPFHLLVPAGRQAYATLTLRPKRADEAGRRIAFGLTVRGDYLLQGGERIPGPGREAAGRFLPAPPRALLLSVQPGEVKDRVPAQYEVLVSNPSLQAITVSLSGVDPAGNLELSLSPTQLVLAPQSTGRALLLARPRTGPGAGQRRVHRFRVTAQPVEGGVSAASAEAALLQTGPAEVVSSKLPWPLIAVVAIALLLLILILVTLVRR